MQKTFTRDAQTWFTYFILAFYGYLLNILGPLTPYLRDELNINYTTAGFHFSAFAVGMLLSGLFGERLQNKWGYTKTIWLSAGGMAAPVANPSVMRARTAARSSTATRFAAAPGSRRPSERSPPVRCRC